MTMGSLLSPQLGVCCATAQDEHPNANLILPLQHLILRNYANVHSLMLVATVSVVLMDITSPLKLATVSFVSAMEELIRVWMEVVNV